MSSSVPQIVLFGRYDKHGNWVGLRHSRIATRRDIKLWKGSKKLTEFLVVMDRKVMASDNLYFAQSHRVEIGELIRFGESEWLKENEQKRHSRHVYRTKSR